MSLYCRAGADLAALVVLACLLLGCGTTNVSPSNRPSPAAFRSPVDLGSPVNSQDFDGGPSISADGLSLYFITDRDVVGGGDIWVAIRSSTSEPFGPPESLGAPVNSSEDEGSPSISADGLELFFDRAPDGRIYVATRPSVIATFGRRPRALLLLRPPGWVWRRRRVGGEPTCGRVAIWGSGQPRAHRQQRIERLRARHLERRQDSFLRFRPQGRERWIRHMAQHSWIPVTTFWSAGERRIPSQHRILGREARRRIRRRDPAFHVRPARWAGLV